MKEWILSKLKNSLKNKKAIAVIVTVIATGFGVANPEIVGSAAATIACEAVIKCEA